MMRKHVSSRCKPSLFKALCGGSCARPGCAKAFRDAGADLAILLHSIAFCPKADRHGRVVDCSRDGFAQAMDISVHSFMRLVQKAEPLMSDVGTCMTVTFYGSTRVIDRYNVMGPVKAALEAATRATSPARSR